MNPDYYDIEKLLKNYPDFDDWDLRCYEKRKWYEKMTKKEEHFNDLIKDDYGDDYFFDDPKHPGFSNCYLERIQKNIYDGCEKPSTTPTTVNLKMGQLIRFREGHGAILKGSMGIIIDKVPGEVQIMTSDDQLVWAVEHVVEVIGESR